jgi:hypothetical protein
MKDLPFDLWNDLRAKRLWPVALVLLAALVAAPVVLSKKTEEPAVAPAPPAPKKAESEDPEGPAALAEVKLEELGQGSGSSLSAFDPSNPFAPPRKVLEAARRQAEAESGDQGDGGEPARGAPTIEGDVNLNVGTDDAAGGGAGGGGDTGLSVDLGGGDLTGGGEPAGGDVGGGEPTGEGDTGSGDGNGDGGGTSEPPETIDYTYVVDATFTVNGRRRSIKGLEKLDILPHAASPQLIFLGVTPNAGNAVFLVDSTLEAAGEGRCKPRPAECAFLYLGPGSEHEFTNEEADSYTLRIDEIRRVRLGGKPTEAKKKKGKSARAAVGQPAPVRRFVPPLLADLVSVSSGAGSDSDTDADRR